ncbi:hypothetical protein J7T55_002302 [Diaporthe amygdali]|uniref:uncharacterized protein n=1 Tax=Phomopsis amygdali TaxID=1214568 RepID=UPI0022FF40B1|nr:uncharacterized protein J7T55_002302 [Diaporthe amygdali]KAJ0109110.1 hypothetical protein J7T55_002302 [Diaporthe amygdali]
MSENVSASQEVAVLVNTSDGPSEDEDYSVFSDALRLYLTYLLGFVIILSTLTATIYFPLIPMLSAHFSVSIQAINLTVTLYAVCQAISPPLFASLADCYGRRPVLLLLIGIYACASLGLALNRSSYGLLLGMRAVQSIGGSATPAIAYGIVADVAVVSERGRMLGPMLSFCNGISAVGPVIGGAVAQSTGAYVWVFLALLAVAVVCFLLTGFTLPETARAIVGNGSRPAHGLSKMWTTSGWVKTNKATSKQVKEAPVPMPPNTYTRPKWTLKAAVHSLRIILYSDAAAILWMIASSYSVYYTFQVAIPVIYEEIYHYNDFQIGLTFLPGLSGMTIGGIVAGKLVDRNFAKIARRENIAPDRKKTEDLKEFPIEEARYRHITYFIVLEVALVIGYGWVIFRRLHPAIPLVIQFFVCAASTLLSHTASALLVDVFPNSSSTSYASGQVMRCGLSAVSAAVLDPLINAIGRGWYFTMFGLFVGLSGIVSVTISRGKGMKWRQKRCH